MSELTCLEWSVALWLVHVLVQATVGNVELPFGYLFTSRDKPAAASGLLFGRATRALANYVENFTPFVAVALALIVTRRTGGSGAPRRDDLDSGARYLHSGLSSRHRVRAHGDMGDLDRRSGDDAVAVDRTVAGASLSSAPSERDQQ